MMDVLLFFAIWVALILTTGFGVMFLTWVTERDD